MMVEYGWIGERKVTRQNECVSSQTGDDVCVRVWMQGEECRAKWKRRSMWMVKEPVELRNRNAGRIRKDTLRREK
jgi:hypothetical protein